MLRHPIQPLETDAQGVVRFKRNAVVCHLLDNGGIDMNKLATLVFSREDREQFAQLIGYSHSGSGDLPYMSNETYQAAARIHEAGETETEARLKEAEGTIGDLRKALRAPIAALYCIHPDDLGRSE